MAQVKVPKYLTIEDKVVGPLTLRQFAELAGVATVAFIFWMVLPKPIAVILAIPLILLGVALAFIRVNEQPFQSFLFAAIRFYINPQQYVWQRVESKVTFELETKTKEKPVLVQPSDSRGGGVTRSRIRELAERLELEQDTQEDEFIRRRDY